MSEKDPVLSAISARIRLALHFMDMGDYYGAMRILERLDRVMEEPSQHNVKAALARLNDG